MGPISKQTAMAIAMAYREVEAGEGLLKDVRDTIDKMGHRPVDIRDAFGRTQHGLQLGVPSGDNGHRLFDVPFALAIPIIETHIAQERAKIALLTQQAKAEMIAVAAEGTFDVEGGPSNG